MGKRYGHTHALPPLYMPTHVLNYLTPPLLLPEDSTKFSAWTVTSLPCSREKSHLVWAAVSGPWKSAVEVTAGDSTIVRAQRFLCPAGILQATAVEEGTGSRLAHAVYGSSPGPSPLVTPVDLPSRAVLGNAYPMLWLGSADPRGGTAEDRVLCVALRLRGLPWSMLYLLWYKGLFALTQSVKDFGELYLRTSGDHVLLSS